MQVCQANSDLEQIWASHHGYVRRLLAELTGDADLTDDLLQETHIKVAMSFAGYRGGNIKAWLGRIARNTFYSHVRKRSYANECLIDEDLQAGSDPGLGSRAHLGLIEVRAAMSALPPDLRDVIIMKHYTGFTYEEIAARLKCPAGTVKNQVHRAVEQLRRSLGRSTTEPAKCAYSDGTALLDYLYGLSSPKKNAEIREHLNTCSSCRENAEEIRNVMIRLDGLESSQKITEMLDLDPQGVPTLYYDTNIVNNLPRPLELAAFRMNPLSTLLRATAQGEEVACEHVQNDQFDWDSGRFVRHRYVARIPEPVPPGERLDLLTVSRMHPDRSARQLDDGRFRFRWTQFPMARWAAEGPQCAIAYSQAIRLPRGSRLLKAYPLPAEIRTEEKTTLIWRSVFAQFGPFDCVVEYRVRPDWPDTLE